MGSKTGALSVLFPFPPPPQGAQHPGVGAAPGGEQGPIVRRLCLQLCRWKGSQLGPGKEERWHRWQRTCIRAFCCRRLLLKNKTFRFH